MRHLAILASFALLTAAPALAQAPQAATAAALPGPVALSFIGADGKSRGAGVLTAGPTGVLIHLEVTGLSPGWHGVHLHKVGACDAPDFKTAGAHVNMAGMQHGLKNPMGAEEGDLPNIYAGADGRVMAEVSTSKVSLLGEGGRPALRDADGSAVVIHAAADNQTTAPIGDSGARIACAVIAPLTK